MKNIHKTSLFTVILCIIFIIVAFLTQFKAQNLVGKCSYLDPITVDIIAFVAALFLVIEGIYRIIEHKKVSLNKQITRSIRVAFGLGMITLHVMQFIHK